MSTEMTLTWIAAWHLAIAIASALTAASARENWQKRGEHRLRLTWSALATVALAQLTLAALALWPGAPWLFARALDGAGALLIGWGLAAPFLPPLIRRVWLAVGLTAVAGLGALSSEPGWARTAWGLYSAASLGAGGAALAFYSKERAALIAAALGVMSLGAATGALGSELAGRALGLAACIALPVGVTRWMLRDLENAEQELQSFSQHALRQTQELLVLSRSSTTLVAQTNVAAMLAEAVEGVALGAGADLALIALLGDDPDRTVGVMALYPPRPNDSPVSFALNSHAVVAQAVRTNQPMILDPDIGLESHPLSILLGSQHAGPALVQPMVCQERAVGVLVVCNTRDKAPPGASTGRLLEALGAQIATAIENVQMYHRLNAQARELAHLLTVREQEASQRAAILESIADGVVVANQEDKIILANAAAADILGVERSELIGRSSEDLSHSILPLPLSVFRASDDASLLETVRLDLEINARAVQASLAPVHTPAGELMGVVAVLRDVTRERQAERAKSEFIATISHELRTPLTSIKGYADLLNTGLTGALSEMQQDFVSKIRDQSAHLTSLINQVIQYSELERGRLVTARQPFDLSEIVSAAMQSARERVRADGLSLTLKTEPGTPLVYADPVHTRQIVDQLLDNALRFTPAPGQIVISIRPASIEKGAKDKEGAWPAVSMSISDTGVGIAPQDLERIFERFYRADNPMQVLAGGLGLGLAIARALAAAQGGQLWAASPAVERAAGPAPPDRPGSTFTLRLPAHLA